MHPQPIPADCPCTDALAAVLATGAPAVCTACGEKLWPHQPRTAPPSPIDRTRVYDVEVDGERRPSTVPQVARLVHTEDAEFVDVRRLLSELRPDKGGPLGWAADGKPPEGNGSNWTPVLRVQTSAEVPSILPGAFASQAPASSAPRCAVVTRADGTPEPVSQTLHWLQRHGTLAGGLRALYEACADALVPAPVRAAWKLLPPALSVAARPGYGRQRVAAAMAAWWAPPASEPAETAADRAEVVDSIQERTARTAAETRQAIERMTRRLTPVAPCGDLTDIQPPVATVDVCPDPDDPDGGAPLRV